ncbi:MAG: efflux RND transporter periplasmic adaptor subunit, partial [Rhodomicrobium sp.]
MLRVLALVGFCLLSGIVGYTWYAAPPPKPIAASAQPLAVSTVSAMKQDIPVLLSGIGAVQALNTVQLRSRVDGTLD